MKKAIGFLLCLFAVIFITLNATDYYLKDVLSVFDGAVLLYFVLVLLGVTLSTFGFKTLIGGINGALAKKYVMTEERKNEAVALFTLLRSSTVYASVVGVIAGLMMLLLSLDDPAAMGPKVAICFASALYGAFINLVFINPVIHILKNKNYQDEPKVTERVKDREAADKLLRLCFEKGLTREDIMNADEIVLRKFQ